MAFSREWSSDEGRSEVEALELQELIQGWGARRAKMHPREKLVMAEYFVEHDLLVRKGANPAEPRETVASIVVNQGTTPNVVVQQALGWIRANWKDGPFDVTWFTTSGLVNATLHDFRVRNHGCAVAAQLFLLPGRVNTDLQAVSGPEAEQFIENLKVALRYAFLSVHAFDLDTGSAQFQYSEEVRLQRACARLYADHKFLFVDSSKFRREGTVGYNLKELLESSRTVTIYTTSIPDDPADDKAVVDRFETLCDRILSSTSSEENPAGEDRLRIRTLRFRVVGGPFVRCIDREGLLPAP